MDSKLMNNIPPNTTGNLDNNRRKKNSILSYNDDMLIEILLRLPAKQLIKFKSVCKHWLSLISTGQFCHLHTLRHPKPQTSLIFQKPETSHFFYFDPILNPHKLIPYTFTMPNSKILSSCNGLLLLQSDQPEKSCYVYNPTTRLSRKISLNPITNSDKYLNDLGLTLAFDPSISSHYKIVCVRSATISRFEDTRCCQIEVYELESSKWKLCVEPFTTNFNFLSSGVHWKNAIHFINYLLCQYFDIDKYVIEKMPPVPVIPWPIPHYGGSAASYFQNSNSHLYHIIRVSPYHGDNSVAVYELQDDYSQWLMKYHDGFGQLPQPVDTLRFIQGDNCQTSTLVYHVSGKIMAYRFLDRRSEELVDLRDQPFYCKDSELYYSRNVHQFGESMAPV